MGRAFEPGNDINHFCMPTAVAVSETTGDFYVADGYCNARIMKYSKDGKLKRIISKRLLLIVVLCLVHLLEAVFLCAYRRRLGSPT